jgi:threonine dehydratase
MIEGNGTIVMEILNDIKEDIDFILVPVGGGGLVKCKKKNILKTKKKCNKIYLIIRKYF